MPTPPTDSLQLLRDDGGVALFRGARGPGGTPVLLLVASKAASVESDLRFDDEFSFRDLLDEQWATRPIARAADDASALWLSDPGGELLRARVGRPWDVGSFLSVAPAIAAAVGRMHQAGLIHRDLKPEHVFVDLDAGTAWLAGFAMASRLPRERRVLGRPERIAGTLAYMAPEQTGRMNRSMDSRSDLYALGVIFYELLAGTLPFRAKDPLEWIHCHVARQPMPLQERRANIPATLAAIVMKLLAKAGEERYQTAAGLEFDLQRCRSEWLAGRRIEPFRLGASDSSGKLAIPERLYGRQREIGELLQAFERVVEHERCELTLVSGYAGVGKSSLVNELHKAIALPGGIFISGKFDQRLRDTPYATLAEAFRGLVRQIMAAEAQSAARWKEAIVTEVGSLGGLLFEILPELVALIGPQPPLPLLSAGEASARFRSAFQRLVQAFARKEHPLVLFLDDLQWMDPATLSLLEYIATHPDSRHLHIVGAYRDNEVDAIQPLLATIAAIRAHDVPVLQLELSPLGVADVALLVHDALRLDGEPAMELAALVHEKTGGNPFFTGQFLANLDEEGVLRFDAQSRAWQWDAKGIAAKSHTDNQIELMVRRLWRLPPATQEVLKLLACFGSQADVRALALVDGSEQLVHERLLPAVEAGVVLAGDDGYRFLHDRVQEGAYALIPEPLRGELHLRIGKAMASAVPRERLAERIFDIANQLNAGQSLLDGWSDRVDVASINLGAGRQAKAATAYEGACSYLSAGLRALGADGLERAHDLAFELGVELAECEICRVRLEEAGLRVDELFRLSDSGVERARAHVLRMTLLMMRGDVALVVRTALEGLDMLGQSFPPRLTSAEIRGEYDAMRTALGERPIESLVDLPLMDDPEAAAAMSIMMQLGIAAYFVDANLYQAVACRLVRLTLTHGLSDSSTYGCAALGISLGPVFGHYADGERFARAAVAITERGGYLAFRSGAFVTLQQALIWTRPVDEALSCLETSLKVANESGALIFACFATEHRLTDLLFRGDRLDVLWGQVAEGLAFAERCQVRHVGDIIAGMLGFVRAMHCPADPSSPDEAEIAARVRASGIPVVICFHAILQMQRHFLLGDAARALELARQAEPLLWSAQCHVQSANFRMFEALAIAATYAQADAAQRLGMRAKIADHLDALSRWAGSCPSSYEHRHALVAAQLARVDGRALDSLKLHERAIRSAATHGFCQDQALACELAASACLELHLDSAAQAYRREARENYLRWGAHAKVEQLDGLQPGIGRPAQPLSSTIEAPLEQVDLDAVAEMIRTISGEIVFERLVDKLMTLVVEHAGAQRGLLVLSRDGELRLEAAASAKDDGILVQRLVRAIQSTDLPLAVVHEAIERRQPVVVEDASLPNPFAADAYIATRRPRSLLCLPLIRQTELVGVMYLENNLASRVFTPPRNAVLELLSSQAAISLQNAGLYDRLMQENLERRLSEAALRESDERYALAIEAATDGHADWLVDEDLFYASPRLLEQWGLQPSKETWRHQELLDVFPFHPHDRDRALALLESHRLDPAAKRLEFDSRVVRGGEVLWMHTTVLYQRDATGRLLRTSTATTDITVRMRAEEALRSSEERYALALAGSNESIFDLDLLTGQHYLARRTQELLGLDPGEPLRTRAEWKRLVYVHPDDLDRQAAALEAHLAGLTPAYDIEVRHRPPQGLRWLRQRGRALRDAQGRPYRFVGTLGDVTERKREQEEVHRLESRLRTAERFEAMGTLAGGIAHDFNNILGAILGFGERALAAAEPGSRLHHDLGNVIVAGERGRELVERILTFSRGAAGERVPVHVENVVQESLALLKAKLPAAVSLQTRLRAGRAAVLGDATQIHQLVMNLGTNAMHAIMGKGTLSVTLDVEEATQPRPAMIGEVSRGSWVVLRVADDGSGIAEDILGRIFDPFFTTREAGVGTGLGLSLVLRIVTQAGGAIDVGSRLGAGSAFSIFLPRAGDAPEQTATTSQPIPTARGQRVLVVDDEAPLLELMVDTLRELGYMPSAESSGDAALVSFRRDPGAFDVLVTDQRMPGMSGDTLIREVRRINPSLPAILVSGYVGSPTAVPMDSGRADEVLAKPLRPNALAASLARVLAARSPLR